MNQFGVFLTGHRLPNRFPHPAAIVELDRSGSSAAPDVRASRSFGRLPTAREVLISADVPGVKDDALRRQPGWHNRLS
jgi:hypothetical protein